MITYRVTYERGKSNPKSLLATPTEESPEIIITTDFGEIGIIPYRVGNYGMSEAIEAVGMITNCIVLSCKRV